MDSYDVRFWDTKKIADNASGGRYRVRWAVNGQEHCKSFKNKTLADGFLDDLKDAARDRRPFSPRTGLPAAETTEGGDGHLVRARPQLRRGQVAEPGPGLPPVGRRGPGHRHHRPHREGEGRARGARCCARALFAWAFNPATRDSRPAARRSPSPSAGPPAPRCRSPRWTTRPRCGSRSARAPRPWPGRRRPGRRSGASGRCSTTPSATPSSWATGLQPGRPHPVDRPGRRPERRRGVVSPPRPAARSRPARWPTGSSTELKDAVRDRRPFDPRTGLPEAEVTEDEAVTWYAHARAYTEAKWANLAPVSRRSVAEALVTVTIALSTKEPGAPDPKVLRQALFAWAFNPATRDNDPAAPHRRRPRLGRARLAPGHRPGRHRERAAGAGRLRHDPGRQAGGRVDPAAQAVGVLQRPRLRRRTRAASAPTRSTGSSGPPPPSPRAWTGGSWSAPPRPGRSWPPSGGWGSGERTWKAFFACLYYAALRPSEAVMLREADLHLPKTGWGRIVLVGLRVPGRARPGPTRAPPARNAA